MTIRSHTPDSVPSPVATIHRGSFPGQREYAEANSRIRRERLGSHAPALTAMVAQTLDPRWLLEIEAVASG